MRRFLVTTILVATAMVLPRAAQAALITGELDFAGGVVVSATEAHWYWATSPTLVGPQQARITGSTVADGGILVPGLLPIPPTNVIHETNLTAATPPGTALSVNLFEYNCIFNPVGDCTPSPILPTVDYVLNYIDTCAELAGPYICLGAAPFGFIQNSDSVTVVLQMRGTVFDTATPSITNTWEGSWSTQVAGAFLCHADHSLTPPCDADSIFGIIEAGGSISNSYSATKITASPAGIPEPATLLTFGTASLLLARYRRRRNKKA